MEFYRFSETELWQGTCPTCEKADMECWVSPVNGEIILEYFDCCSVFSEEIRSYWTAEEIRRGRRPQGIPETWQIELVEGGW